MSALDKLYSIIRPKGEDVRTLSHSQECVYRYHHANEPKEKRTYGLDGFGLMPGQRYSCPPDVESRAIDWIENTYPKLVDEKLNQELKAWNQT